MKVEDIADDALPDTIQIATWVSSAEKLRQLGKDAMLKIADAITTNTPLGAKRAMFMDLDPYVGDLIRAILQRGSDLYFGLCHDEAHLEWLRFTGERAATDMIIAGDLIPYPGFEVHADITVFLDLMIYGCTTCGTWLWASHNLVWLRALARNLPRSWLWAVPTTHPQPFRLRVHPYTVKCRNYKFMSTFTTVPPIEMPDSQAAAPPPQKPELQVLAWADYGIDELGGAPPLKLPAGLLKKYHDHPNFADNFRQWLKRAEAEHYLNAPKPMQSNKRSNQYAEERPKKVPKVAKEEVVFDMIPITSLPEALLHRVPLLSKECLGIDLVIASGPTLYLCNTTDNEVQFPQEPVLFFVCWTAPLAVALLVVPALLGFRFQMPEISSNDAHHQQCVDRMF